MKEFRILLGLLGWLFAGWQVTPAAAQTYTPSSIAVSFTDLTATGTVVSLGDDQVSAAIGLPFTFSFFGTGYSSVYVSSNGFITFLAGQSNGCCAGQAVPNAASPNGFVAGAWNDLYPPGGGSIRYETTGSAGSRVFIVMYKNLPNYSGSAPDYTFNIKLFEGTNVIEVHIVTATNDGSETTVGIENPAGTVGFQSFFGAASLSNVAFRYTPASSAPVVTTAPVSALDYTAGSLNGSANPNGAATTAYFRYGTDPTLTAGTNTVAQSLGSGTTAVAFAESLTGLFPQTTYYYRAIATNSAGTSDGAILNFTTPAQPPTVVTQPARVVVPTGALLNGTVSPNSASTSARFEYSTDPGLFGSILTPIQNIGAGAVALPVSAALTDLVPRTTYYFRAVGTNSGGTVNGAILNFTTNVVSWGGAGADSTTGVLDTSLIPTSGTRTFSDVNGQGYYVVVTTAGLGRGGSASYFGDPGWWFEGGGPSSGYGTVTFQFFNSVTNAPYALSGVDFRLLDTEINERFRNFGYWDENNTFVSVAYGTGLLTFSHTPIYHASDGSYDSSASQQGGDQVGKWIELNLSNLAVNGFTFQAHRQTSGAGSVIMSDLVSPWAAWRTTNFSAPPYPATAEDLANPDSDGSVNILEYFYGTNPNVIDSPDPLVTSVVASRLTLTFPRNLAATDTTATVQGADSASGPWTDLARSTNGGIFVALVVGVPVSEAGAGVIRTIQVGDEYLVGDPLHPTRFLRLQVVH